MNADNRMPVVYLSHGAPPLADDELWTSQLARWSARPPRPRAVLVVSAHWESAPVTLGATRTVPLVHDFWGFPERYYDVRYAAPGAPGLAERVRGLLGSPGTPVHEEPERGLDHGAYVPLVEMFPEADVPVLQMSMPTLEPAALTELGRSLAPLREEGVLIIVSGFFSHNLKGLMWGAGPEDAQGWSKEFDAWGQEALARGDVDTLLDFAHKAPAGRLAHPRTEHFAPLFVSLGAGESDLASQRSVIDGFWNGLAKRSIQLGWRAAPPRLRPLKARGPHAGHVVPSLDRTSTGHKGLHQHLPVGSALSRHLRVGRLRPRREDDLQHHPRPPRHRNILRTRLGGALLAASTLVVGLLPVASASADTASGNAAPAAVPASAPYVNLAWS